MLYSSLCTIAYYVLLEAWRSQFFITLLGLLFAAWGGSLFLAEVAVTETRELQSSLLAMFLRLSAVYLVGLFVVSSMVREFQEQGMALCLASPMPRYQYFFGKLLGFCILATLSSVFIGGLLNFYSVSIQSSILWTLSLWCELLIIVTASLLLVFTLPNTMLAFSALLGFYVLARSVAAIQLMANSTLYTQQTWQSVILQTTTNLVAWLLPNFTEFTRTEWLVYATPTVSTLWYLLGQTLLYMLLLSTIGLFDLYRKNV